MKICPLCDVAYPEPHTRCPEDGALLLESRELAAGQMVRGKYKIVRKIGQGGMGTVYLAEDTFLNAHMALKFLSAELSSDPSFTRRFRDEARAAFRLRHPNIVEVTGLDQSDEGSLFIAMEYVDGLSLRAALDGVGGPLAVPRAVEIARGIASGLGAAHLTGFVHRDIKPENIVLRRLGETEQPKILDFGIVAVMERAQAEDAPSQRLSRGPILTAEYAAPEQWGFVKPEDLDGRTDLYALGCVFYEMLTGHLPFSARSHEGWMEAHLRTIPAPPSSYSPEISRYPGVDELVLWTLKKQRDDRPADVKAFLTALDAIPKTPVPLPQGPVRGSHAPTIMETASPKRVGPGAVQQPVRDRPMVQEGASAPVQGRPGWMMWGTVGLLALVILGFAGYEWKGHKEGSVVNPVADTPVRNTGPGPTTNVVTGDAARRPGKDTNTNVQPPTPTPEPPKPKVVPAVPPSPAAMEKQALAFYANKDYVHAGPLFQQACGGGEAESCRRLAEMYSKGEGFAKDPAKVVELRQQACDANDMAACYQLGFNYSNGEGVPKDMQKFEELESKACDGKYPEACMKLGALYLSQVGFKDKQKAAQFYEAACENGSREGCFFSGSMYGIGNGVAKDSAKANEAFTKSCRLGYEKACEALKAQP